MLKHVKEALSNILQVYGLDRWTAAKLFNGRSTGPVSCCTLRPCIRPLVTLTTSQAPAGRRRIDLARLPGRLVYLIPNGPSWWLWSVPDNPSDPMDRRLWKCMRVDTLL